MSRIYEDVKDTHPEYDPGYMKRLRAWYSGGRRLLNDNLLLDEVFPRHSGEEADVYEERKKRLQYINYPGQIIDSLIAELRSSPITISGIDEGTDDAPNATAEWYKHFYQDCSPPGGKITSLNDLVAEAVREALITKVAWVLVDLPDVELPEGATQQVADESGQRDAYVCLVPAEKIRNWEVDSAGELVYLLMCDEENLWGGLGTRRGDVKKIYSFYTRDTWERWSIVWKKGEEPKDDEQLTFEDGGNHTFGRVPWARLEVPDGLWAMNKLESIARAWFNKRNALDWSTYKNLFPILYATIKQQPIDADGQEATDRLLKQKAGPGRLLVLGEDETLQYAQPNPGIYAACLQDLRDSRDEMHRVTFTMAQSVDNSGAALQRAASSKAQDRMATAIVLGELGNEGRKFTQILYTLVTAGRGDAVEIHAQGLDGYSDAMTMDLLDQAIKLETIDIPSETFHRINKYRVAKSILGREANETDSKAIQSELKKNITLDTIRKALATEDVTASVSPTKTG